MIPTFSLYSRLGLVWLAKESSRTGQEEKFPFVRSLVSTPKRERHSPNEDSIASKHIKRDNMEVDGEPKFSDSEEDNLLECASEDEIDKDVEAGSIINLFDGDVDHVFVDNAYGGDKRLSWKRKRIS